MSNRFTRSKYLNKNPQKLFAPLTKVFPSTVCINTTNLTNLLQVTVIKSNV